MPFSIPVGILIFNFFVIVSISGQRLKQESMYKSCLGCFKRIRIISALMILERSVDRAAWATPKLRVKTKKKFSSIFRMLEPSAMTMGSLEFWLVRKLAASALYRAIKG